MEEPVNCLHSQLIAEVSVKVKVGAVKTCKV
jgi:hypothetical protein